MSTEEKFFLRCLGWAIGLIGAGMVWVFLGDKGVEQNFFGMLIGTFFFLGGVYLHRKGKVSVSDGSEWPPRPFS